MKGSLDIIGQYQFEDGGVKVRVLIMGWTTVCLKYSGKRTQPELRQLLIIDRMLGPDMSKASLIRCEKTISRVQVLGFILETMSSR